MGSIHNPDNIEEQVTVKDEGGGKFSLDTNIKSGNLNVTVIGGGNTVDGSKLKIEEMTKDQSMTIDIYNEVYSTTTAGQLYSLFIKIKKFDALVKLTIDSNVVFQDISMDDLRVAYLLGSKEYPVIPSFQMLVTGLSLTVEMKYPIAFSTEVKLEIQPDTSDNELERGMVIRSSL